MDKNKQQTLDPGLYLVSTPIGNMEDITLRALNVLRHSNIILCEDTRRSGKLLSHYKIKNNLISYHKFNENKVCSNVINSIKKNNIVSLISDAGTPTISDPGMMLVNKCIKANFNGYPVPGSSAVTSAVSVSGFRDQYLFYGFLPKKESELEYVFKNFFSDRKIVIAKEMTKIHEEFIRDDIESIKDLPRNLKGELTVVLSEKRKEKNIKKEINESVSIEIKRMLKKYSHKDVVEFISKKENLSKKLVYDFCLKLKK